MFKHILLASALLLPPLAHANTEPPAWGLIIKLKDSAPSTPTRTQAQAHPQAHTQAQVQARLQTALQRTSLPQTAHRALIGQAIQHVGTDRLLTPAQAQALATQLLASGEVEWVAPNRRMKRLSAVTPTDAYYSSHQWWAFEASGANTDPLTARRRGVPNLTLGWDVSTGSSGTIVAVLDTGVIAHEDLNTARYVAGRNFHHGITSTGGMGPLDQAASDYSDPGDGLTQAEKDANPVGYANCNVENSSWHGTAVTGIIAATANGANTGIAGTNWATRILPVRIAGKCGAWDSDIIDAMNWVADADGSNGNAKRADVINLSFGGDASCASNPAYAAAIALLRSRGVVLVAAAGNDHGAVSTPANCAGTVAGVISVAALNRDGFKANYSNFGAEITLSTVGGDTTSDGAWGPYLGDGGITTLGNSGAITVDTNPAHPQYYNYAGTSMATPIVSATVALMLAAQPALTVDTVISTLRDSVRPHVTSALMQTCSAGNPGRCICTTATCGAGILDVERALLMATGQSVSTLSAQNIDSTDVQAAVHASSMDSVTATSTSGSGSNRSDSGGGGGGGLEGGSLLALGLSAAAMARAMQQPR